MRWKKQWGVGICLLLGISTLATGLVLGQTGADDSQRVPVLPEQLHNYANPNLPLHYQSNNVQQIDNTPNNNMITDAGATLGRVLFYDTILSANDSTSCASCHVQELGFTDNRVLSVGFDGELTGRHSMRLGNALYYGTGRFFWDERSSSLEDQVLRPIQDPIEMGLTLEALQAKVAAQPYYPELFTAAFGSPEVTTDRISLALAQFVRSMVTFESKYDEGVATNFANFTPQENQGRELFFSPRTNCSRCHETDTFSLDRPRNNGLDGSTVDLGLAGVTGNPADEGKFKSPSLRNVAVGGPYMHDGRFATLEEVVRFYNQQIEPHPNLDERLKNEDGNPLHMRLTPQEREALVAFLETLTDQSFLTDPKFSDPFVTVPVAPDYQVYLPIIQK